jgi:hypothetical protein
MNRFDGIAKAAKRPIAGSRRIYSWCGLAIVNSQARWADHEVK